MKKQYTLLFSLIITISMAFGISSCNPGVYGPRKTGYYQREARKYRMLDQVVDCPQYTKQPAMRKAQAKRGKKRKFLGLF